MLEWFYLKDRSDRNGQPAGVSLRVVVDNNGRMVDHRFAEVDPRTASFLTNRGGIVSTEIAFCFEEPELSVNPTVGPAPQSSKNAQP